MFLFCCYIIFLTRKKNVCWGFVLEYKRKSVIIVDDSLTNLNLARNALAAKYDVFTISSGKKLFQILERVTPDIILLDIEMPGMSGYEIIEKLKKTESTANIPVIFITAVIDPQCEVKGLGLGAVDYITRPFSQQLLLKRVEMHLLTELQNKEMNAGCGRLEDMIDEKRRTIFELQNAILETVAELVECRDSVTGGHIERIQVYLRILIDAMLENDVYAEELSSWDIGLFIMSSQLHDVGKISINDNLLMKQGKLSGDEYDKMKWHTNFGMNIILKIERATRENAFLRHARITAGSHHEKWDGTGYFLGLKGENIPLQGRLMSIVDVYDALTHKRQYKEALSHKEAIKIIQEGIGTHFDPRIGEIFVKYEKEIENYSESGAENLYHDSSGVMSDIGSSVSSALTSIVDVRDKLEGINSENILNCLKMFIEALLTRERYRDEVSQWDLEIFLLAAQLHDVGKFAIKDELLKKPERFTSEEFETIKGHADFGVQVISHSKGEIDRSDLLRQAEALIGSHHERWDGSGYPLGLKGEAIPLQGRVMAIIDVYEALTSNRPHRKKISHDEAVKLIKSNSGKDFDPELVDIFMENEKRFSEVCSNNKS